MSMDGRFCLTLFRHEDGYLPNGDEETGKEDYGNNLEEMVERAERIWAARKRNGYKLIEIADQAGEEWVPRRTWPESAIDRLYE